MLVDGRYGHSMKKICTIPQHIEIIGCKQIQNAKKCLTQVILTNSWSPRLLKKQLKYQLEQIG